MNESTSLRKAALGVASLAAVGNALLAIAHTGVEVPLLSALGPSGGAVPPAVVAFTVGTLLFAAIAVGLWREARWARPVGIGVAGLSILSGLGQFRGMVSAFGIVLAAVLLVLLVLDARRESPRQQTA